MAMGIKVKATVNHIASGQPLPQTTPQESPTPPAPPGPPPATSGTTEWPILPLAGIAAGTSNSDNSNRRICEEEEVLKLLRISLAVIISVFLMASVKS